MDYKVDVKEDLDLESESALISFREEWDNYLKILAYLDSTKGLAID